jgi:threonine dehydrogenase-like Zn-dependent dehydrogenase
MRAVVLREGEIVVRDDVEEPTPAAGQVLVQVKACGICGSDLHFARHGAEVLALGREVEDLPSLGTSSGLDLGLDVYMGHEFAAEVLELGPGTDAPVGVGTLVTSMPALVEGDRVEPIVYSNTVHGGYGERMLLSAPMLLEVPNGLPAHHAALTEPMAVGLHAVNRSEIEQGAGAVVLGSGPVGLAVIAALAQRGIEPIVAADLSATRRVLAQGIGAHVVVDPRASSAWEAWRSVGAGRPLHVYEAIGVPGIIDDVLRAAPTGTRVTVVGVCMEADTITPFFGITKELSIQFVLGYDPTEFARSLRAIAEGEVDVAPLVTARVPLDRTPWAFDVLGDPEGQCKIIVEP